MLHMWVQFLEKENNRLQSEIEDLKKELNSQKDLNNLMHNEIASLESNVKKSKVCDQSNFISEIFITPSLSFC